MLFRFHRLRFSFLALDCIRFPSGAPANVLRGALGTVFRHIACSPECPGARCCERRHTCAYARVFEPAASGAGPSGLANWPRPFVFRARRLDGAAIQPREPFSFDLHVFALDPEVIERFVFTFREIGRQGLGPGRGRARLCRADQLDIQGETTRALYDPSHDVTLPPGPPSQIALDPVADAPQRIRVEFLTPTELKHEERIAARPEFAVLFARVRDRIATLSALYGGEPLAVDFKAMAERAARVRMPGYELRPVALTRRSSRTGQVHPIGGLTGWAEYEGDFGEFIPYLEAARWTGAGRQTVWGNGEIAVAALA
jgi:hypothetical protein